MPNSIQALLEQASTQLAAISPTARLDAEILLSHCLDKNRSYLRAWPEKSLTTEQLSQFLTLIDQRQQGTPIAYLTGSREFWSRNFKVSQDVLIPRPDTELLIELSLSILPDNKSCKIIDLGTGSGVLAITIAAERPLATVIATDISPKALQIAQSNAEQLNAGNIRLQQSNWFDSVADCDFDLVISNPPYITANDPHLQQGDVRFEPRSALISAENGLKDIRLLAEQARRHLKNSGYLMIEHGYNQQTEIQAIFKTLNYRHVATHQDLSGNPRVTSGLWIPT